MPGWAQLRAEPGVAFRQMYQGPDDARWTSLADPNPRGCGLSHYFLHRQDWVIYWVALGSRPRRRRAAHSSLPAPDRLHTAWRLERDWACSRPLPIAPAVELAPAEGTPTPWAAAAPGPIAVPAQFGIDHKLERG